MAGGIWFLAFVCVAAALALSEYTALARARGGDPPLVPLIVAGLMIELAFYQPGLQNWLVGFGLATGIGVPFPSQSQLLMIVLVLSVLVLVGLELFRNKGSAVVNLSSAAFGLCYVSLLFGTWIGIREMFTVQDPVVRHYFLVRLGVTDPALVYRAGGLTVISIFAMIWICDSAAFHFGKSLGKHRLFPRVSPNKTWEGAVAGFIFAIGTAVAAKYLVLDFLPVVHAAVIGAIVGSVGQLGDLAESLLKRDAGVKDSSNLIPGHGGALDRFDSLLFVSPALFLYLDFIVF
jgi:phosphatidate cytidylyltransferase